MKDFEIFRTGEHTSSNGITKNYTEDDLQQIADTYNSSEHEAPIVLGHPESNAPAYGWIEKIYRKADKLFAKPKSLVDEFVQAVKDKKFNKRSISLTKDGLLNHVGFLGAAVPAVKGLADVEFNSEEEKEVFEFAEIEDKPAAKKDDSADDSINTEELNSTVQTLAEQFSSFTNDFKEIISKLTNNSNFMESNQDDLKKLENRMSDLRTKIDLSNFELSLNERVAYGSLTPAMKKKALEILNYFENLNYSESTQEDLKENVKALLVDFLDSIPKLVEFEDVADHDDDNQDDSNLDEFNDFELDPDSSRLHSEILKTMQKDSVSYEEAFHKVVNEQE